MPITIDLLSLDTRKEWVSLPVDPADPSKGSARFELQDVPYAKWQSLVMEAYSAAEHLTKCLEQLRQSASEQANKSFGEALSRVLRANAEIVKWGVCGHDEISNASGKIAHESQLVTFDNTSYKVASDKTLLLYTLIGRDERGGSTLLNQLVAAVRRHQAAEPQPELEALWSASSNA